MIYELRIYTACQGRMPDLLARFRDHTLRIFERHGMKNVGYWLNTVGGRTTSSGTCSPTRTWRRGRGPGRGSWPTRSG